MIQTKWYMLTLVGQDRPGIVAHITGALFEGGCNLGEAAMLRLGGNFSIMLMVHFSGTARQLHELVAGVAQSIDLQLHVDAIDGRLHDHLEPNVRITVYGADRSGLVAKVTGVLAEAGLHITDLESDVAGTEAEPIYILFIEGYAREGVATIESALEIIRQDAGFEVAMTPIDTYVG